MHATLGALCLTPNPEDNPGVAFNTEWPWSGLTDSSN